MWRTPWFSLLCSHPDRGSVSRALLRHKRGLLALLGAFTVSCGAAPVEESASIRHLPREPLSGTIVRLDRTPLDTGRSVGHGYVAPYSTERVISDFWECRGHRRHRGIDLAGVGPVSGLGTPVVSMARARITHIGTPEIDAHRYGRRLDDRITVHRGGEDLPTSGDVPGYGNVWFFTDNYGSWRTGVIISTEVLEGPLAGHEVRYMHLAAPHPNLQVGDVVEAGQELGVMGGTAILQSTPHVHIDAEDPTGRRIDLAPYIGLPVTELAGAPDC